MRFILARHGETEANVGGIYSGWTDFPLTDKGKKQIKKLGKALKRYEDIECIYSSPLQRALSTAKAISKVIDKQIHTVDCLKEMNFGVFDGKTGDEIQGQYQTEWKMWIEDYVNYRIPEGENLIDVYDRIIEFIDSLKNKEGTCLIVTHGGIIQTIITYLLDIGLDKMWHFQCPPAGYAEIEYSDNFGFIRRLTTSE